MDAVQTHLGTGERGMAYNYAGDVIRIDDIQNYHGVSEVVNVYHVQLEGPGNVADADLLDAMVTFVDGLHSQMDDVQVTQLFYVSIKVVNTTHDHLVGIHNYSGSPHGTVSADPMAPGCAGLVTLATGKLGTRGRKFIAGISESLADYGVLGATALGNLEDYALYLVGPQYPEGVGILPGVLDKVGAFWPFIEAAVRTVVAYQRRRKQGVGA
jgi:hypothetical protein